MFTSDFVISMFVFLMMVNVTYLMWIEAHEQQERLDTEQVMQQKAYHIASLLVRTPGYPANWTNETVAIIGLAEPDHVLQDAKMQELDDMRTTDIASTMGLDSQTNVLINVTNETGTMQVNGRDLIWGTPPADPDSLTGEQRSVLVNATNLYQRGTLHVQLWR